MDKSASIPHPGLGYKQFVALIASFMAINALGTDMMLPALGQIGTDFGVAHGNDRQWVVTAYIFSSGVGQIIYGTLADRYGRKPVLSIALLIYIFANAAAAFSTGFDMLLAARVVAGMGAAGARVLAVSIVRDCYAGRTMARVMSFAFLVFVAVPVLAPSIGQALLFVSVWRSMFIALAVFGAVVLLWMVRKLGETQHPEDKAPIQISRILAAAKTTLSNRVSLGYSVATMLIMGCLFGFIGSSQQVFADVFHEAVWFPASFAFVAAFMAISSFLSARFVNRFGSRVISHSALLGFILTSAVHLAIVLSGHETIWTFIAVQSPVMFFFGALSGNFNAMAMEPMGHIAGSAASIQGFVVVVGGSLIGFFIGQCFNGTLVPMAAGFLICGILALGSTLAAENGRLFHAQANLVAG